MLHSLDGEAAPLLWLSFIVNQFSRLTSRKNVRKKTGYGILLPQLSLLGKKRSFSPYSNKQVNYPLLSVPYSGSKKSTPSPPKISYGLAFLQCAFFRFSHWYRSLAIAFPGVPVSTNQVRFLGEISSSFAPTLEFDHFRFHSKWITFLLLRECQATSAYQLLPNLFLELASTLGIAKIFYLFAYCLQVVPVISISSSIA